MQARLLFERRSVLPPLSEGCKRCNGPQKSDCMGEELDEFLSPHRVFAESDLSVPSKRVTLMDNFDIVDDTFASLIQFSISSGFFALRFGSGMIDSDIIAFEPNNNVITVADRYANQHGLPKQDITFGGTNDVVVLGYDMSGGVSKVKFSRKLDTGDPNDKVIVNGTNDIIFAYHDASKLLTYHSYRGSKTIDLRKSE